VIKPNADENRFNTHVFLIVSLKNRNPVHGVKHMDSQINALAQLHKKRCIIFVQGFDIQHLSALPVPFATS